MPHQDGPALSRGVIIYGVIVLLVVVGVLVGAGLAIRAPSWLTVVIAAGAGIGYVVGAVWWVRAHVPPGNRSI
jgi:hypothetical protein